MSATQRHVLELQPYALSRSSQKMRRLRLRCERLALVRVDAAAEAAEEAHAAAEAAWSAVAVADKLAAAREEALHESREEAAREKHARVQCQAELYQARSALGEERAVSAALREEVKRLSCRA
jgi:hypothetical protein